LNDALLEQVLAGSGEMGQRVRAFDWSATPLGPVSTWTQSLRNTVGIVLATRHPMLLWWCPDLIQFYNDAYRQSLGPQRHPGALGQPGRAYWADSWNEIGPQVDAAWAGQASWREDHRVPVTRGSRTQDAYWSYSVSPVRDDSGDVGGILLTGQETTRRVLLARRSQLLAEVSAVGGEAASERAACAGVIAAVSRHRADVPFARLYLRGAKASGFRLEAETGLMPPALSHGSLLSPRSDSGKWALESVFSSVGAVVVSHWGEGKAMLLPFRTEGRPPSVDGVLVAGVSPRLPLDEDYRAFLDDLADRTGRSVAGAQTRVAAEARESELRSEVERLAALFEQSPGFVAVLRGPEHTFELANPAYRRLVGHREVLGKPVREALPEVAGQGIFELLDGVYRTGEPFVGSELPMQLQRAPGAPLEEHYFDFSYQAMRDPAGAIWGILATGHDVTELVRSRAAAERLAAERNADRQKLLTVLAQSPLAILIAEAPSGRVLYANPKLTELFGGDANAPAAEGSPLDRALHRGETVEAETVVIERAEGGRLELSVNAAPVLDDQGRTIAAVAFFRDVTVERRREQLLRDAQRLQSVGTLAGGVAHEINNQMTVVLSFGEFILEALGADHPQASDMQAVLQAGRRAARVSQQLLAFTRRSMFQPRDVSLSDLTAALLPVLRQLLGRDKTLELSPSSTQRRVYVDPTQIEQVLINLVANSRDATPTGGRVTIAVEDVTQPTTTRDERGYAFRPGEYVRVSVTDTGRGMDRPTLGRVFEPFFTTKPVGEGTGLGLSMVYGIVKQHGGYIEADSTPGSGTVFRLYLPALGSAPGVVSDVPDAGKTLPSQAERLPGTVVVVEDEEAVQLLVVRGLERLGYTVLAAADGTAAIELMRATPKVSLVITDVIMPHMNGRELYEAMAEVRPSVPVLFMSGYSADTAVLRELVPRGAPFLQKPFTVLELAEAVGALLEPRRR
jgi:signal transduction histidine kinase/CheY-like chemotaxis protein